MNETLKQLVKRQNKKIVKKFVWSDDDTDDMVSVSDVTKLMSQVRLETAEYIYKKIGLKTLGFCSLSFTEAGSGVETMFKELIAELKGEKWQKTKPFIYAARTNEEFNIEKVAVKMLRQKRKKESKTGKIYRKFLRLKKA